MIEIGYLQHGAGRGPFRTESVKVKHEYADNYKAFYEGKWRKLHIQVKRCYIMFQGEKSQFRSWVCNMKHWILTRERMQDIITCLDLGRMTLKAAKLYYSAYGVEIKGNTKGRFIKKPCKTSKRRIIIYRVVKNVKN